MGLAVSREQPLVVAEVAEVAEVDLEALAEAVSEAAAPCQQPLFHSFHLHRCLALSLQISHLRPHQLRHLPRPLLHRQSSQR